MDPGAYPIAMALYPLLLIATMVVGVIGIGVDRRGSRRVGVMMIACQLALLGLSLAGHALGIEPTPRQHLVSMAIINGLSAIPLLITPPSPPYPLQRYAAGMFWGSAMMNAIFYPFPQLPSVVALNWFASAAIDLSMIILLGGWCGGVIAGGIADRLRGRAWRPSHTGDHRG